MPATTEEAEAPFHPSNRKYLGSKRLLSGWIGAVIRERAGTPAHFLDGFCGTGAVALEMAGAGTAHVTAVDSLQSNCLILRGFAAAAAGLEGGARIADTLRELNALAPREGYVTESYAGAYFTRDNCMRMDAVRERIEEMAAGGGLSPEARDYLLASFLLAADRVANTIGQYDAFLKNMDGPAHRGGRHLVDERVRTPFRLRPLAPPPSGRITVIAADILQEAARLPADAAYLDPPYNGRQYIDNYHVLENLARWEKPVLRGKTRKFDRGGLASPFCRRRLAGPALSSLVGAVRAPHVFLSYNSEGILAREEIREILCGHGETACLEVPYPVFGNGAGVSRRRTVTELLFHVRRSGAARG
jgi:adenine-specific DNA-methyltransferase